VSWFQIQERGFDEVDRSGLDADYRLGRVSPENLLQCLELAGVNETAARLAVKEVFEAEDLYPLHTVLSLAPDTANT
jgi:hypothetical protein